MELIKMKLKQGFSIQKVAGKYIGVPLDEECLDFQGVLQLNETGYRVWQGLEQGLSIDAIAEKFVNEYEGLTIDEAKKSVQSAIDSMIKNRLIEED